MGDALNTDVESIATRGLSRRNALKAGVAVGVGAAAWSGAAITSLGSTPAYATTAGCTGVTHLLLQGCRNSDQGAPQCAGGGEFRYHTLNSVSPPFTLANNPGEGTCCDVVALNKPVLSWSTPNQTCVSHVEFWINGQSSCDNRNGTLIASSTQTTVGGPGGGSVVIDMTCFGYVNGNKLPSPAFWTIFANCASNGAPSQCL